MGLKSIIKKVLPDDIVVKLKDILNAHNNKIMRIKSMKIKEYDKERYPLGINLIGDIRAETGLGQSMRIIAHILEESNISFMIKQINSPGGLEHNDTTWDHRILDDVKYSINLIHINPNTWAEIYNEMDEEVLNCRYNIAYWLWELEEFPKKWVPCLDTVDEVWTPSEFISKSIRKRTVKPVITIPYSIELDTEHLYDRKYFNLPEDKFLYLVMYDFKSISERKNPKGTIRAFKKAFDSSMNIGLIIKVNHLKRGNELEDLKKQLINYSNVYYITDNLSRREVESLIGVADVLLSLHRSEGFGLPLAEAMYLGTPTVATNWSANTEFMDEKSSCLVNYRLIPIEKNIGPYEKGNQWAEADEMQAAEYVKRLYVDKEYRESIKIEGQSRVREILNSERASLIIKDRMENLN